ncbi:transferase [Luteimonas sp. RD2P54]|uniref:Transferase n=1 Tax=Luteimonas endophytica TaxID=3042023 RepID=A0ABT6JC13_9GAMM|nr:transferase [Luteimonas endophytica]MDH5823738.1 transferase [Luteimonas endophytica]
MADGTGGGWRAWLRALLPRLGPAARDAAGKRLRKPFVRRYGRYTSLQFTRRQTQSRMLTDAPDVLLIDYTRTMLGALLLQPRPDTIGMIGLGGGSQAKFCYRHLAQARIEVVENNPHVIRLRDRFGIPADDARLQVFLDDGARFLQGRRGRYGLLLVDGYDETGIPPPLSTQRFYDDCRGALADGGVAAFNLFCADAEAHLARLRRSFGAGRVLVVGEANMSNRVALAWTAAAPATRAPDPQRALEALPAAARAELAPVFARVARALGA